MAESSFAALSASPMLVGVSVGHLNATSADVPRGADEFGPACVTPLSSGRVDAPFVAEAPAVLVRPDLPLLEGTLSVDPEALRPVGRLWGAAYAMPGEVRVPERPS